jgi:hypothetical protein
MTNNELTNAIINSDLPINAKILVLSGISTVHRNPKARKQYEEMMSTLILEQLSATEPKRVKDIAAALGGKYTVQRLTQIISDLVSRNKIKREVVNTGRTLVFQCEVYNYNTYRYEWKEKEISETYAVFTLA